MIILDGNIKAELDNNDYNLINIALNEYYYKHKKQKRYSYLSEKIEFHNESKLICEEGRLHFKSVIFNKIEYYMIMKALKTYHEKHKSSKHFYYRRCITLINHLILYENKLLKDNVQY